MEPILCSNEACSQNKTWKPGRKVYRNGKWLCTGCAANLTIAEPGKELWSFDTMHIGNDPNQGPIQVKSLRHLRQLEQQYGVSSVAANYDSRNW